MKTAVILSEGIKQIVFTPESTSEKYALSLITAEDDIEVLVTNGQVGESSFKPFSARMSECRGGFLRLYSDRESRILVLKPKKKSQ